MNLSTDYPLPSYLIVFEVNGYPNHCGIYLSQIGFMDNSLLGTRCIDITHKKFPKGSPRVFKILGLKIEPMTEFFNQFMTLPREVIAMERANKGWYLTREAPDFVMNLRSLRSKNKESMNCVEWVLYGLELGGLDLPMNILTPNQLAIWCINNLVEIEYGKFADSVVN